MALSRRALSNGSPLPPVNPDVMRLYNSRFCPFAQRTRMVLLHKNIEYETVNCHLMNKPDWLLERNPKGKVPVLEYKNKVVYESSICNEFLDNLFPVNKLQSDCPYKRAEDQLTMDTFDVIAVQFWSVGTKTPEKTESARRKIARSLDKLEATIKDQAYFGGGQPFLVDFHMFPWFERMPALKNLLNYDLLPEDRYPRLVSWYNRMQLLPAVRENMFPTDWHMRYLASLSVMDPQFNTGLDDPHMAKL